MKQSTYWAIKSPAFGIIAIFRNEMLATVYAGLLKGKKIPWRMAEEVWDFTDDG